MAERQARYVRITVPEPGKILLSIGPGDHTVDRWQISRDDLKMLVMDGMKEIVYKS